MNISGKVKKEMIWRADKTWVGQVHTYLIYILSLLYEKNCTRFVFTYIISFKFYYSIMK